MKITIKNFQSIEDITFDIPEKEFTCIVGPSNIGKSAIRRALSCLLYNTSESSYIRTGTKECSVEIIFDDGMKVKWFRNEGNSGSYEINGVSYSKLNKTVPQPILDKGFKELFLSKDRVNVQSPSQYEQIFLLNETGSKVTEVFSNLGNLNKIIIANKACTTDLKATKNKLSIRKDDLISAKERLKNYRGLDEQRHFLRKNKDSLTEIKALHLKHQALLAYIKKLNKAAEVVKALRPVNNIQLESFDVDLNKVSLLRSLLKKFTTSEHKTFSYSKITSVKDVIFDLDEEHQKYLKLKKLHQQYEKVVLKKVSYQKIPDLIVLEDFDLSKVKKLQEMSVKLMRSKTELVRLRTTSDNLDKDLKKLEQEEKTLHESLGGVCPLCNGNFEKESTKNV